MGAFHDMVTNSGFQIPTQGPEASLALSRLLVTFSPFSLFRSIVSMSERLDSFFLSLIWEFLANLREHLM
jgi:hypothetical protein